MKKIFLISSLVFSSCAIPAEPPQSIKNIDILGLRLGADPVLAKKLASEKIGPSEIVNVSDSKDQEIGQKYFSPTKYKQNINFKAEDWEKHIYLFYPSNKIERIEYIQTFETCPTVETIRSQLLAKYGKPTLMDGGAVAIKDLKNWRIDSSLQWSFRRDGKLENLITNQDSVCPDYYGATDVFTGARAKGDFTDETASCGAILMARFYSHIELKSRRHWDSRANCALFIGTIDITKAFERAEAKWLNQMKAEELERQKLREIKATF